MVERPLIRRKLLSVQHHLERVRSKKRFSQAQFIDIPDLQDIVLFHTFQAIQDCIDLAAHLVADEGWEIAGSSAGLIDELARHRVISRPLAKNMRECVGFRNVLVHGYRDLDFRLAYRAITHGPQIIKKFCLRVATYAKL